MTKPVKLALTSDIRPGQMLRVVHDEHVYLLSNVDGQILVLYDILGVTQGRLPRFVKNFNDDAPSLAAACAAYVDAVKNRSYPAPEHCFS